VMQVRFHPAALPVRCWRFGKRTNTGPDHECAEVNLGPHHSTHLVRTDVSPGVVGLRWDWE